LVDEYDHLGIEDLGLAGMARTKLARGLHDSALRQLRDQLTYKAAASGVAVVRVGRFYPSSKTCSVCGAVNDALRLTDERWGCECGANHDRDLNAAINILQESLRLHRGREARGHVQTPVELV
jgi:putative transposase